MKNEKNERGIALIPLIAIILIIAIIGGVILYFVIANSSKTDKNNNKIMTDAVQNNQSTNKKQDSQLDNTSNQTVSQIKEKRWPGVFEKTGTGVYPPQSYVINNIISINPNKDERFYVQSAAGNISSMDTKILYLATDKNEVEIDFEYNDPNRLTLNESINGMDIYILNNLVGKTESLKYTRYILLNEVPFISTNSNFKGYKYYIVLKPNYAITNKEICEIAKNITVDTSRGEFSKDTAIVLSDEYLTKKVGNYTFNFKNVILTNWTVMAAGNNEITYFVKKGNGYTKTRLTLPAMEKANVKYGLAELKKSIEKNNQSQYKTYNEELVEIPINRATFYAVKLTNISNGYENISKIFFELDNNNLMSLEAGGMKLEQVQEYISQNVIGKVLFVD